MVNKQIRRRLANVRYLTSVRSYCERRFFRVLTSPVEAPHARRRGRRLRATKARYTPRACLSLLLDRAMACEQFLEARRERHLDLGTILQPAHQHSGRLNGRQAIAAGLATQLAVA